MKKSLFIVIDGIDGSGKSEMVKALHNYLFSKSKMYRILTTREPTNGIHGVKIRSILRQERDPKSSSEKLAGLFIKDREQHLKNTIEPFLESPKGGEFNIVICDRYYYSTIAFQGAQGLKISDIMEKNRDFRKPDIAFILDVEPSRALKRIAYREKEKFEQPEFMEKIRLAFLKMPELLKENIKVIDASRPFEYVFGEIKMHVDKMLR